MAMKKKRNQEKGDNDVDKIVLKGSYVHCTEQSNILSRPCEFSDYESTFGYCKINNNRK